MRKKYIVSPFYDYTFIILCPLIIVLLAFVLNLFSFSKETTNILGFPLLFFVSIKLLITSGHIYLSFFRTHLNKKVLKKHVGKFSLALSLVFGLLYFSDTCFGLSIIVLIWWDVWHTSMQSFGFGRIYDVRAGNDPKMSRTQDWILNLVIYIGPILAGLTLKDHVLDSFVAADKTLNSYYFFDFVQWIDMNQFNIRILVIGLGILYIIYYILFTAKIMKKGYVLSTEKTVLYFTFAGVNIYAWGFNGLLLGYFIVNVFHGIQYYFFVFCNEIRSPNQVFNKFGRYQVLFFVLFFLATFLIAVVSEGGARVGSYGRFWYVLILSASFYHYWVDGFVWSVRKRDV